MATTYNFKILTPSRKALDTDVISIVAPGATGYLGILANHAPIITTLKAGNLKVRFADGREASYFIGSGILKVSANTAVLLTESIRD